jgi:inner membrane protein
VGARIGNKGGWRTWSHLALWALLTHPLLDVFTSFGTQLLSPFSTKRFAFDAISIIDPVYTFPLIGALVLAFRRGPPTWRVRTQRLTSLALGWGCVWIGVGLINHSIARGHVERALTRAGFEAVDLRVMPLLLNHFSFRYAARDASGRVALGHASVTGAGASAPLLRAPADGPAVQAALAHRMGQRYAWFADHLLGIRTEPLPNGVVRVHLDDLRYGAMTDPTRSLWSARFDVAPDGTVLDLQRDSRPSRTGDPSAEFAELAAILSGERW